MIIALLAIVGVAYFLGLSFAAWSLMLGVGVAHAEWWAAMPTMGFSTALWIVFVATLPSIVGSVIWAVIKSAASSD